MQGVEEEEERDGKDYIAGEVAIADAGSQSRKPTAGDDVDVDVGVEVESEYFEGAWNDGAGAAPTAAIAAVAGDVVVAPIEVKDLRGMEVEAEGAPVARSELNVLSGEVL
ncbi:hypothetical protein ABW19_dt0203235 [Dactylella cylindrospora]|nr:hypothetical protein ABW19_dt0203235 [Dactylella cylindrospora]